MKDLLKAFLISIIVVTLLMLAVAVPVGGLALIVHLFGAVGICITVFLVIVVGSTFVIWLDMKGY